MRALILAALLALPTFHEDDRASDAKRAQVHALADAIAEHARTPEEIAFLVAWGNAESGYSLRVHAGNCRRRECDGGLARSPWQLHRAAMPLDTWARMVGVENTRAQAEQAAARARWALAHCPSDRVRGAFRVLGGHECDEPIKDEAARVATFERVAASLKAK